MAVQNLTRLFERQQLWLFVTLMWHTITIHHLTVANKRDVMRADEKIWNVVYAISQARQIRPSNEPCKISPSVFSKMSQDEVDGIFKRLDKDEDVINLINIPKSWAAVTANSRPDDYRYVFGVKENFDTFYENKYREYYQAIHNLATENFLSIFDLVLDIEREIQMSDSNKVSVDVLNRVVRFSILFPRDSAHFRDAYCKRRIDSVNYLKRHGAIKSYNLKDNVGNGWDAKIEVEFSTPAFDGFADKMKARYKTDFHKQPKLVIDKQPKPQPNYPDDAPAHFDNDDEEQPTEHNNTDTAQDKVRFDVKASKLTFNGKTCDIPDETLEHYICKLVFKNRRVAAKEDDILEYTTKSQESQRAVYDAMLRINKKASNHLGTPKLLSYKAAKVRIAAKYQ